MRSGTKFNPFLANVPILYPLETPDNLWFSGVFREYKRSKVGEIKRKLQSFRSTEKQLIRENTKLKYVLSKQLIFYVF